MALWSPSAIVNGVSGKLGAVVFHRGSRANVVAKSPSLCRGESLYQLERRLWLAKAASLYYEMTDNERAAWSHFAATHPVPDRFGRARRRAGVYWFIQYFLQLYPIPTTGYSFATTPLPTITEPLVIDSVSFTQGGPYNITLTAAPPTLYTEYLHVQRHLEYGARPGAGASRFIGHIVRNAQTVNWFTPCIARGFAFRSEEQLRLSLYWFQFGRRASNTITATTTVV